MLDGMDPDDRPIKIEVRERTYNNTVKLEQFYKDWDEQHRSDPKY